MKKRGFSLIELIIVIAVISAISAMIIPSLTGVQSSAQSQAADAAADAMTLAIIKYRLQGGTEIEWDAATQLEKYGIIDDYIDFPLTDDDLYADEAKTTLKYTMPDNLDERVTAK